VSLDGVQVHLVDSVDAAGDFLRWLSFHDRVALDTECSGLDKDSDRVRLVQFGDAREAWAIPFERWGGVVEEAIRKFEGRYSTHNGPMYDCPMLRREGIRVAPHRVDDTRFRLHVLESTGSLALKNVTRRMIDPRAAVGQQQLDDAMTRGGWDWATVPVDLEPYWFYGGVDTVLTYQLEEMLRPQVEAEALRAYELELAVSWIAERMERKGVRVDREYVEQLSDQLTEHVLEVERWCRTHYGVSPGSSVQVIRRMRDDGVEFTKTTQGGSISLDKYVLEALADVHPLAGPVLSRRQAEKLVSTYLRHYVELSERDGRIHPSINTVGGTDKNPFEPGGGSGVRTGRMSMDHPNLQNVPRRGPRGKAIRRCFWPTEGNLWMKCDADQIEMRMMAHFSQDPGMIQAFLSEGDFFVNMARNLFNEPDFQREDPRRDLVKNGNYGRVYGAGPEKFSATAGVPLEEGTAFMRRFDALYPRVPAWIREVERLANGRLANEGVAYVRSPLTGRRHVADARRIYALVNYLIQGTAAELLKLKAVAADHAGLGDYLTLFVHDEFDLDVPEQDVREVAATLLDVVSDDETLSVPLTWSVEIGPNWGECSELVAA
jgi:DNA polymerase-1